jgi:hypothetical protein
MDTDKSKDNPKAIVDIATLCDRANLEMKPIKGRKKWRRPKADYVLSIEQRRQVLKWMKTLRFPDGYAHNVNRGVNLTTMRVNDMKSHDYHVWIEWLLPTMVRGFVPENIWHVLVELSYFFWKLCVKEISRTVRRELEKVAPVLLCKLEKIFPPGFFLPIVGGDSESSLSYTKNKRVFSVARGFMRKAQRRNPRSSRIHFHSSESIFRPTPFVTCVAAK